MGFLDKLFGGVVLPPTTPRSRTSAGSAAHRPAAPGAKGARPSERPANPMRQPAAKPKPEETQGESAARLEPKTAAPSAAEAEPIPETLTEPAAKSPPAPIEAAPPAASLTAEDILAELFAEPEEASAGAAPAEAETSGSSVLEAKGTMGSFVAEPVAESAPGSGASVPAVAAPAETPIVPAPTGTADPDAAAPARWSDVTQRKLDRYFARMRQAYPDGVIVRLNTGQKKLAERGAQLRREIGMEGRLDDFFALGEFTYRRSEGGRPSVVKTDRQLQSLLQDLKAAFPQGVPSVAAVQQADHRLYLNLRAAARHDGCTMTDYLKQHDLLKKKECVS